MKSRISIDVDYDNQPIIKIEYSESDDVRDKLVKRFLEMFGSDSSWASFRYYDNPKMYYADNVTPNNYAIVRPIGVSELDKVIVDMQHTTEVQKGMMQNVQSES